MSSRGSPSDSEHAGPPRGPIVVLGGYGYFGRRVCAALAEDPGATVLVAGRDRGKAEALADALGARAKPLALDARDAGLARVLKDLGAAIVIHTAGPFQSQDYGVASACIEAGCHYLDIADGRAYVARIGSLDARALERGVLIVSGASSVPALSSAVVDRCASRFARLDAISHGITSSGTPPGLATVRGVLGYAGRPFARWQDGAWINVHGWQDLALERYPPPVGRRWLAACDVPDLELFPRRYPSVRSVVFRAGLGFAGTTLATAALAWLVRTGLVRDMTRYAAPLRALAAKLARWGTAWSAMHVTLSGVGHDGEPLTHTWYLLAGSHDGASIPCLPAIALARKLVRGALDARGALPCVGLLTVDEILGAIPRLDLTTIEA